MTQVLHRRQWLSIAAAGAWSAGLRAEVASATQATVVVIRHAETDPGIGDPPGYRLDDCSSQRQLSAVGRAQAARLAASLAAQGWRPGEVRSSHWCRCLDTARLAFGSVEPWAALDSFFDAPDRGPAQTAQLRAALAGLPTKTVAVWVTHQVNIQALTGESVGFAEALVLRSQLQADGQAGVQVLGRFATPAIRT